MVKIDIKEFCMSGKPGFLSHACSGLFCDETENFQQLVAKVVDRNSCLTSPTELREGAAWDYFTVVKYLTLVSGSLLKCGFLNTSVRQKVLVNVLEKDQR